MSESMKKYLEIISKDAEMTAKLKGKTEFSEVEIQEFIEDAKGHGIVLTEADFNPDPDALSDDDLEAVAGGDQCYCAVGGGGNPGSTDDTCACVGFGMGGTNNNIARCGCAVGGYGTSLD